MPAIPIIEACKLITERKLAIAGEAPLEEQLKRFEAGDDSMLDAHYRSSDSILRMMVGDLGVDPVDLQTMSGEIVMAILPAVISALNQGEHLVNATRSVWVDGFMTGVIHGELRRQRADR